MKIINKNTIIKLNYQAFKIINSKNKIKIVYYYLINRKKNIIFVKFDE